MHDLLILYSGGADSRLMLELAFRLGKKPYCLLVHYGQLHEEELHWAAEQLDKKKVDRQKVTVSNLNIDSGLTGSGEKNRSGNVHEMHVPGRNTIFLSLALSIAESKGISTIWIGCDWSDRLNLFPDCYQEYLVKVNELFKIAGPKPITVEAPLMGMSKEVILHILKSFAIDMSEVYSGYGEFS